MGKSVVVIGTFDGVHLGHRALLQRARTLAAARGLASVIVVTFDPHPLAVLAPARAPQLLTSLPMRIELLKDAGASEVRVVRFTAQVADWSPEQFVMRVLVPLDPALVLVGDNFTFGRGAAGNVGTLTRLAAGRFEVVGLDLVAVDHQVTSSTMIRAALQVGDLKTVTAHLGRPYRVRGVVVVGDQRGRQLGFPTANLPIPPELATPADGVYAGWLRRLDEPAERWPAAISVGSNPTFDGVERHVEANVLDRCDLELYGIEVEVSFVAWLRGQERFADAAELIAQLKLDVAQTRVLLNGEFADN